MHIIISYEDIELVRNKDGSVTLFEMKKEAARYAKTELNFLWKIVEV